MVSAGLGVSIVPDWAPPRPAGGGQVSRVPLPGDVVPQREIGLLWHRSSPAGRLVDRMQQALLHVP